MISPCNLGAFIWGGVTVAVVIAGLALWGTLGIVIAIVVCGVAWGLYARRRAPAT